MGFFMKCMNLCRRLLGYIYHRSGTMRKYYKLSTECSEYENMMDNDSVDFDLEKMKVMRKNLMAYANRAIRSFYKEKKNENQKIWSAIESGKLDKDFPNEVKYIREKNQLVLFPYDFSEDYHVEESDVFQDDNTSLKYVIHNGSNLYFPTENSRAIADKYYQLIMEQDKQSPHRYFEKESFDCDVFVDVGSAEGIIALNFLNHAKEIYLLECSEKWVEALKQTFRIGNSKANNIHIIRKYAGSYDDDNNIMLDTLLKKYSGKKVVIKMDIEGMEIDALRGTRQTMRRNNCIFSCTTYHTNTAEQELSDFFKQNGYRTKLTDNYMLFIYGAMTLQNGKYQKMKYPFFRHGIIRAVPNGYDGNEVK